MVGSPLNTVVRSSPSSVFKVSSKESTSTTTAAAAATEMEKLKKRLELITGEYNKLVAAHSELQRNYNLLNCSSHSSKSDSSNEDRKTSFPSRVLSFVGTLLFNEKFSDLQVVFSDDTKPIPCHSFVLDARGFAYDQLSSNKDSTKRDDPFNDNENDSCDVSTNSKLIRIPDASREIGTAILKWMYTDFIQLESKPDSFLLDMLRVSSIYQLTELKQLTERSLTPSVDVSNVIQIYQIASQFSANFLKQHCSNVMFSHWSHFSHSDFEPLDTDTLYFILKQRSDKPLHAAIRLMREDVVFKYLIEYTDQLPTALNISDESGEIPLYIALNTHQFSIATLLVSYGADVNIQFELNKQDPDSETSSQNEAASAAVINQGSNGVKNTNLGTGEGAMKPLLFYFIMSQDNLSTKFLLDISHCDMHQRSNFSWDTLLHTCASIVDPSDELLEVLDPVLEETDFAINAINKNGQSALHLSIINKNLKVFNRILNVANTDVNLMNQEKLPPLWLAVLADTPNFSEQNPSIFCAPLLKRGAKIDINITKNNVPLLNHCAKELYEEAAMFLVQQNCNINHQDSNGLSILHIACMNNLSKLVIVLLDLGANANIRTKFIPADKPRPPPLTQTTSASGLAESVGVSQPATEKRTKIVKRRVVRKVEKKPTAVKYTNGQKFNNDSSTRMLTKQKSQPKKQYDDLNPFADDSEDGGEDNDNDSALNPFLDVVDSGNKRLGVAIDSLSSTSAATNPFEDNGLNCGYRDTNQDRVTASPGAIEFEEIEEWIEEEVTDDESEQQELNDYQSPECFGNALNKFTFDQSALDNENDYSDEAISLATEASNQTPLHLAIWHKHENIVDLMLRFREKFPDRINLDAKNSFDQTPFALSLWLGLKCADRLLQAGSNINDINGEGETLLQQAILHQDCSSALFLLERNADFTFKSIQSGDTCLMLAIKRHLPLVVDALCIRGADMSQTDKNNNFPLWVALETGQEDVASILVKHGCDANGWHVFPPDAYFQTLLHRAIKEKNEPVACFLIRCSGNTDLEATYREISGSNSTVAKNKEELERQDSPGHLAARTGLSLVLEALLEHGFKVNLKNAEKKTSLHVAIESENSNCIDVLMTCPEVSLSVKDFRGLTPFGYTLKYRNDRAANLILQRDPSAVEHLDNRGRSLLHIAVQSLDLQSVLFLITCRANVNAKMQDKSDMTPLHVAAVSSQPNNETLQMIMRNLLLAGANINALTKNAQTALHLAAERGSHEICVILLEQNGACDVNIQDAEGNTALHLAVKNRQVYTIKKILEFQSKCKINMKLKNARGRNVLHTLAACSSKADSTSVMSIFPLLIKASGESVSLNEEDGEGNTMLLLAYINGHSQLCRALVARGVSLGNVNKQSLSIFTYPAATPDLLHSLLRLVSSEPAWSESDTCLECGARFTVTFRRHHCRHCGRVLCSPCSTQLSPIPKFHIDKNVRVCQHCFHVIKMGGAI